MLTVALLFVAVPLLLWVLWFSWLRPRLYNPQNLSGKLIVVTGCDSGFGKALVRKLDSLGSRTVAACLTQRGCDELNNSLNNCKAIRCDVTSKQDCQDLIKVILKEDEMSASKSGRIDRGMWALVNNAGVANSSLFECLSDRSFQNTLEVNYVAARRLIHLVLPMMKKENTKKNKEKKTDIKSGWRGWWLKRGSQGRIINVCSVASHMAGHRGIPYCTSKCALRALSDCLRYETQLLHSVWISTIEPQFTATPMVDKEVDTLSFILRCKREIEECSSLRMKSFGMRSLYDIYDFNADMQQSEQEMQQWKPLIEPTMEPVLHCILDGLSNPFPLKYYHPTWIAQVFFFAFTCLPRWIVLELFDARNLAGMARAKKSF